MDFQNPFTATLRTNLLQNDHHVCLHLLHLFFFTQDVQRTGSRCRQSQLPLEKRFTIIKCVTIIVYYLVVILMLFVAGV